MRARRRLTRQLVEAADVIPEADLQETVRQLAVDSGRWDHYYHTHNARHSPEGFPDVLAIRLRDGRRLVAELKREGEEPTPAQRAWLAAFAAIGWETYVWYPRDLDEIERIMR